MTHPNSELIQALMIQIDIPKFVKVNQDFYDAMKGHVVSKTIEYISKKQIYETELELKLFDFEIRSILHFQIKVIL